VLSYLTYYSPTISPAVFNLFPLLHAAVLNWAFEYSMHFLTPVDNFISRGKDIFLAQPDGAGVRMVIEMATAVLVTHGDRMPDYEAHGGVKLLESLLHNCRGAIDAQLGDVLNLTLTRLERSKPNSSIRQLLFNVLSSALHYNAALTLSLLAQRTPGSEAALGSVLGGWMTHLGASAKLRVHDLKLSVLGVSALLELPSAPQASLAQVAPHCTSRPHGKSRASRAQLQVSTPSQVPFHCESRPAFFPSI
tara:strand:+ start:104 stop:850 length:747 start_codon:yes stop_codon:yes gene_type:complete